MIDCIIIEDELPAAKILEMHIAQLSMLSLKGVFRSAQAAKNFMEHHPVSLLFLDIHLPQQSGLDFARTLPANIGVIFTTAYAHHATEGFELDAMDYLLKPISFDRFAKAVARYLKYKHQNASIRPEDTLLNRPFVFVRCERQTVKVFLDEICYLEAQGNYVLIVTSQTTHKTYLSISEMEEKLPPRLFLRIHRSFLISLAKLEGFNSAQVVVQKKELPIGRHYSEAVSRILNQQS
jgi:DNA-binding LytR/AlgR family response regulator